MHMLLIAADTVTHFLPLYLAQILRWMCACVTVCLVHGLSTEIKWNDSCLPHACLSWCVNDMHAVVNLVPIFP